ncbi:hypothetical protein ACN8ZM_39995 (plasmid) [Burkholderia aenigmatica]|uniref:hypothetical protein n=1 Tax=Burkholderia aenigmatica TaxID=2015348 RepID=UPI003B42DF07
MNKRYTPNHLFVSLIVTAVLSASAGFWFCLRTEVNDWRFIAGHWEHVAGVWKQRAVERSPHQ